VERARANLTRRLRRLGSKRSQWVALGSIPVLALIAYSSAYEVTLWDWLELLIVPAFIAGVGIWFNNQQSQRQAEIEDRRAQDNALQAYLEYLSERILQDDLRTAKEGTGLRRLTRARTLTLLESLGPKSKGRVILFLAELELIQRGLAKEQSRERPLSYKSYKKPL